MNNIAFIGLGNMGSPMAINLVKAGYRVKAFDLITNSLKDFVAAGGEKADSAIDAVRSAEVVISMLPAGEHVYELYNSDNGLLAQLPNGCLVIDSSTIDANTARQVGESAAKLGIDFIDAPVSGGVSGAIQGTLSFIVGGELGCFNRAKPILEAMGKNIFHAGNIGSGQIAKTCNNMLLSVLMAGTAEALQMGIENGLDPKVLSDIMLKSSGRNWALEIYNPVPNVMSGTPACNNYKGGFMVDLMNKDLGLAFGVAQDSGSNIPMGKQASVLFNEHANNGNGRLDFSSIFQYYNNN